MSIYEGLTLGFIVIGVLFIIIGFTFDRTKKTMSDADAAMEDEAFRKQVNLINEKVLELNDYHDFVKEEIEKKHKELLFLYQMIGEKEKNIKNIQVEIEQLKNINTMDGPIKVEEIRQPEAKSNSNRKVIALKDQGYDATEIAKILGIGRGEVELVLNLFE